MDDALIVVRAVVALAAVLALIWVLARRFGGTAARPSSTPAAKSTGRRTPLPSTVAKLGASVRRAILPPRQEAGDNPQIQVLSRAGIAPRAQLVVAEFDGIRYILGVTDQGVTVVDTQEQQAPQQAVTDGAGFATISDAVSAGQAA
ncbi:flagellar biosynthetic protein FliO [Microbacterium suaedae]|uniref:flagellar biosynthetic protein FliO n=1 Tax=Microbacterium suaedae TaxID=2067813 RepID=UPI0013A63A63|nr:flagellar biosynthetic protein FliO [Microbacterium suaedae]